MKYPTKKQILEKLEIDKKSFSEMRNSLYKEDANFRKKQTIHGVSCFLSYFALKFGLQYLIGKEHILYISLFTISGILFVAYLSSRLFVNRSLYLGLQRIMEQSKRKNTAEEVDSSSKPT